MSINLRSLSFLIRSPLRSSTMVPLPDHHHQHFSFNNLKHRTHVTGIDLLHNMVELVKAQENISRAVSDPINSGLYGRDSIEEYLENDGKLLDVCNSLLAKIESVQEYGHSVKRAVSLMSVGMEPKRLTRVKICVDDVSVEKCWSGLKRLVVKEKRRRREGAGESLTSSLIEVVSTCRVLDTALSFKKRRGSGAGVRTGQMVELGDVIVLVKRLRDRKAVEACEDDVANVKKKCEKLVDVVGPLEERVKELYSQLVCIRMALLGAQSRQNLARTNGRPCLIAGDFNATMNAGERSSSSVGSNRARTIF